MTKKNARLPHTLALLLTLALSSCAPMLQSMQPTPRPLPPLRVGYTQWWGDYTLLVAKEKGYFKEQHVEVEPVYYPVFSDSFRDLAAGQIDGAFIASGDAMNINRHMAVQIIGVSDDGSYMPIVARPEIKAISDLRGKTIGALIGTQYELLILEMLASAGLAPSDVTLRNIEPENLAAAMAENSVQAGFIWEPYTSQLLEMGAHVIYPTDETQRLFPDTIVFRKSVIEQRPEEIRAFMKAWFAAVNYRLANPEETQQIAAQTLNLPAQDIVMDPNLKIFTYEDNVLSYADDQDSPASIYGIAKKTAEYLLASGTIASMPDIESILTPKFLSQE
ncbi:MAG: aliphatic sulfonate ABC transporter substrate-binding protein [Anaerolineales bacterium]